MATKNFADKLKKTTQNEPTKVLAGTIDNSNNTTVEMPPIENKKVKSKEDRKYLRLDITDYQEYVSLMADYKQVSITNYIQTLIKADMNRNEDTYIKLKEIKQMMANI